MATQVNCLAGPLIAENNNNLKQNNPGNAPALLQLPTDVLKIINRHVATGDAAEEIARNAISAKRTCALLHVLSHENTNELLINIGYHAAMFYRLQNGQ